MLVEMTTSSRCLANDERDFQFLQTQRIAPAMCAFAEKMYEAPDEAESEHAITFSS